MATSFSVLQQWCQNQLQAVSQHSLLCFLLLFSLFILFWLNRIRAGNSTNLPPSPPKLPIIGHLNYIGALPHRSLQALSNKYGPLMLLYFSQIPTLVVSSPEMAKQIMKTHDVFFSDRPVTTASKAFCYGGKDLAFAPYGEYWRQVRKLCILDLLSVKRVQSFRFVREEETGNMITVIKKSCSGREQVNLSEIILTVTNNVISRVAMSRKLGKSVYGKLSKEALDLFGSPSTEDMFPSLRWIDVLTGLDRRMKRTSKALFQFYDEVFEERSRTREDNNGEATSRDFVDLLLDHENDSTVAGVKFTRENLKAVLMNMFVAGTDTIYTNVEWTMAELLNHPNVMNKVQEEVRRVVGTQTEVDEDEIKHMDYFICVIKETMRLHPPFVMNLRSLSTTSTSIAGYHIPAGTTAMINTWAIARDPAVWENPDEFIPERFIDNPVDFRGFDFEFIPFGAGRRGCPGITFGMNSVEIILANLLCWFDWELPGGESKKNIDMTEFFGLIVRLKSPLPLFQSHIFKIMYETCNSK